MITRTNHGAEIEMADFPCREWGERGGVSLKLLEKFTKPGDERFGRVMQVWNYRGDLTQTGDQRLRESLGDEAYRHLHWDAVACTGGVMVVVPRWQVNNCGKGDDFSAVPAPYWWAMSMISKGGPEKAGIRPCTKKEIAAVVPETQVLLAELPGLKYMYIRFVSFYSSARPGKVQWRRAPKDVRFFVFSGGYGCLAIAPQGGKGAGK